MNRRPLAGGLVALLLWPAAALPQTTAGRSPNVRPAWTLGAGAAALRIGHRFEFLAGGDELLNFPTLTLGIGLGRRLTGGLDFATNSEIIADRLGGNETQPWVGLALLRSPRAALDLTGAYNSPARSFDGAASGVLRLGALSLLGEVKAFQDAGGTGEAGAAGSVGAALAVTPRLDVSGDFGGLLTPDGGRSVWSAGLSILIPGSPHTLSLHATNGGATTLQGSTQRKVIGSESMRIGFVFTIPLGSARQWASIFRRNAAQTPEVPAGADALVHLRQIALEPVEIRVSAGQSVAWLNHDPLVHTITADDGSWESGNMAPGATFLRRFDRPGRYPYHCLPHPQMRGVIIVE